MRRFFRILLWGLAVVLVVAGAVGLGYRDRIARLYSVQTLFDQDKIVGNFSAMKDLFFWAPVRRAGPVADWPEQQRNLVAIYKYGGAPKAVRHWLEMTNTTSLLVIVNGAIAFEDYDLGTGPEDRRMSWSMAKSFLSAMFGIAVADGRIASLDDPVEKYVPLLKASAYAGVTIRNVLNMASGVSFDEDYIDFFSDINRMGRVLALGGSMDAFAASLTGRIREQGLVRQYTSIDSHVLAMVLVAATGKRLPALMEEILWSKIGAEDDAYYLTDGYGAAFALGGLNMRTRDYARFGQMMLDFGSFNGEQIIPADWARQSVRPSAPPPVPGVDRLAYGYQWWVPVHADDEFYAVGVYGQYIYVNRPARVVVVKTSADREFVDDGAGGASIEAETIEMFRAIATDLTGWQPRLPS